MTTVPFDRRCDRHRWIWATPYVLKCTRCPALRFADR